MCILVSTPKNRHKDTKHSWIQTKCNFNNIVLLKNIEEKINEKSINSITSRTQSIIYLTLKKKIQTLVHIFIVINKLAEWKEALESKGLRISRTKTKYLRCDFATQIDNNAFNAMTNYIVYS